MKFLNRLWFVLTHDLTSLKQLFLVFIPSLLIIVVGVLINRLDPEYQWFEPDKMYWGDIVILAGIGVFIISFGIAYIKSKNGNADNRA